MFFTRHLRRFFFVLQASHVPLYLFTFYLYRSVCRAFGHQPWSIRHCPLLRIFSSRRPRVRTGRFKRRSFGADEKIQTNRERETYSFRSGRVLSDDSNMCVIFSILYNYFKLHLRTVDRASLICSHIIIYRVSRIIYFSSNTTRMT